MTKDEIIKRVELVTKSSVELSQPVLVYNDGFKDGANFVLQNLQQTVVMRSLPLSNADLWEMSKEITGAIKKAIEMPPDEVKKVWFDQLEGDWFDWLEEKLMGNDA